MVLNPDKIFEDYNKNAIDKNSASNLLISIIEDSEEEQQILDSLSFLKKIGINNDKIFHLVENLLISDSNEKIRNEAATYIQKQFLNRALEPIKWALRYEKNYNCIVIIIKTLELINNQESKIAIFNELKKIKKKKYIDDAKQFHNKKFRRDLKILLKHKKIIKFSCKELAEILLNYKTIEEIIKRFLNVYYEIENGLVTSLDLSELGWNVNIWKQPYANRIEKISEITGLLNLENLKSLDLSNNRISSIEDLINLKNLLSLKISNNKITDIKNLDYINKLNNLKYLDIRRNKIIEKLSTHDFNKELKILYKDYLYFQ